MLIFTDKEFEESFLSCFIYLDELIETNTTSELLNNSRQDLSCI